MHRAASRTPPGWTAQPGPAPPEPALSRGRTSASRLRLLSSPHTSAPEPSVWNNPAPPQSVFFPPAHPSTRVRARRPPLGDRAKGSSYPRLSPGTKFSYPAPTAQHSGHGGGEARLQLPFVSRGMAETWRPCWASPGGRAARGVGLFRETLALLWAGSVGARAERVGRGRPFLEESGPTGFCLQPEVGPVVLQGEQTGRALKKP